MYLPQHRTPVLANRILRPNQVEGLIYWYDADDASTITEAAGAVSQWNDKSGNGRHASQGTGANQPTLAAASLNGRTTITFDGTNDTLATSSFTTSASNVWTIFGVWKRSASGAYHSIMGQGSAANDGYGIFYAGASGGGTNWEINDLFYYGSGYSFGNSPRATATTPASATDAAFNMIDACLTNTSQNIIENSFSQTLRVSNLGTPTAVTAALYLGSADGASNFLNGGIAEFFAYATAGKLSEHQRAALRRYLVRKWGAL